MWKVTSTDQRKLFVPRWWQKLLTLSVLKVPNYLSKLGSIIKDFIQGSRKVSIEVGGFGSNLKSG